MRKLIKIKTVLKVSLLSLSMILITGIDSFSNENGKSNKTTKVTKKVSKNKNDIPKPLIDETPINPRNISTKKGNDSNSVDSSDTSSKQQKRGKKKAYK